MSARVKYKIGRLNFSYLIAVVSINLIVSLFPQDLDNIKIGFVHSSLTKNLLHAEDTNFYPVQDWELFFLNEKISYEVFDDDGVDEYDFDEVDVLILPSVEILSDDAIENLQDFLNEGKGLFILGKLGVKDDNGNYRQLDGLQSLAGIQVNEFLDRNTIAKNHALYANNFLSHNVQSNSSLIVMNNFPLLYTENALSKIIKLGEYISKDNSEDHLIDKAGIVKFENEKGRLLWFGFQLSQISVSGDEREVLQKLIFNSIEWLAGKPIVWINSWPFNFNSATVFTSMIRNPNEFTFEMSAPFAIQSIVIRTNFFLKPDAIKSFPDEVERLASPGDIHVLYDEYEYLDLSEDEKTIMLENASQSLRNETTQLFYGLKYLNNNEAKDIIEKSVSKYFDFVTYDDNSIITFEKRRGVPTNNAKMIFPPSNFSLRKNYIQRNNDLTEYKKYFDDVHKCGGIIAVNYIDQFSNFNSSIESETFKKILSNTMKNYSWIAPYSGIVDWLIKKENIFINIKEIGEKPVLRLVIDNRNRERVENVGIRLTLSPEYRNPVTVNSNYRLRYDALTRSYFLLVPLLLANQSTVVEVYYDN
jgi:hypothetical protein